MSDLREVQDDLLKEWICYRGESILSGLNSEDKKHAVQYEEIAEKILRNVSEPNKQFVEMQLKLLNKNFMDYFDYWCEKYYRYGFADSIEMFKI